MRILEDTQFKLGQVPIEEMTFHPKDRDDIPAALKVCSTCIATQRLGRRSSRSWRSSCFQRLICSVVVRGCRFGASLLGVLKQALNCDFDRLRISVR